MASSSSSSPPPPPPPPPPLLDLFVLPPPPLPLPATVTAHRHSHNRNAALLPTILAGVLVFAFFIVFGVVYRKLSRKRTAPADLKPTTEQQQFAYAVLRRATGAFAAANRLGQGGFGSVYKGILPSGQEVAVKLMDDASSGSLQGEREFHNELSLSSRINSVTCCPHVVSVLGFSSDPRNRRRRKRMLLVYEYMQNGSLQDALLHRKSSELIDWRIRFKILLDIAKGIEFLHFQCDPPIVHSDIKPSNVLLDCDFNAKIADFGLARVLGGDETFIECGEEIEVIDEEMKVEEGNGEDTGSAVEEVESVVTEEVLVNVDHLEGVERTSVSDRVSVDSGNRKGIGRKQSGGSGRDWWWKQDNVGGESGRVKDYVMEWIGSEIKKERPKKDWITNSSSLEVEDGGKADQKKQRKKSEKEKKNRKPREWWKEEFCDELTKKKKKKKRGSISGCSGGEMWWQKDEDFVPEKKRKSRASRGSADSWFEGLSGEFRIGRRNSQDFANGDVPKSGGISSTPSMRGTVCYIAPEKCDGGQLSEKCDVYSFGVLVLVLVSGRRPLQVTASPMSEFERANLISWARQLARNGKLLDLIDPNIQSLDQEQSLLCITIALLCLQRSPGKRPTMKEIVGMLSGEAEAPHLPFEFSPSPPSNFPFKSRKKAW